MRRLLLLILLSSCNLGPDLVGPVVPIPETWKENEIVQTEEPSPDLWWEIFQDETLSALELQAIAYSPDLETALYRVEEAWGRAGIERSYLFPQLSLGPNYSNSGQLITFYQPPGPPNPNFPSTPYRIHPLSYLLPLNLSYELDLWGRIRKEVEAGCLTAEAEVNAYKVSLLTLTTEVASTYFTLKTLAASAIVYQEEIAARKNASDFFASRYKKGVGNLLEVETAQIELSNTESSYADLKNQIAAQKNRLSALIGSIPSDFSFPPLAIEDSPPLIPPGLPSDILVNRPDINEAELRRAAENAHVGSAWASFFPSITLTGALGYLSPTTQDFLKWESRYWYIGAAGDQTLFDGFRKCENYNVAWTRFDQADSSYRSLVLNAFREVEDALSSIRYEKERTSYFKEAERASLSSLSLSQKRFNKGISTRLEVIDNERSTLAARLNHLDALNASYQATLLLIKALGGSWSNHSCAPI